MLKSKWLRFVPFLPLLALLVGVNICGDAGNRFNSPVDVMVDTLLRRYPSYVASGNLDERELRYRYICRMSDDVECVILGGSNVACVTSKDAGTEKFVNLGDTVGRLYDALAQLRAMKALSKDKNLKRVIIGPQEWYFNRKAFEIDDYIETRRALMPFTEYMLDVIKGKNVAGRIPNDKFSASVIFSLKLIFSLSYFQDNIRYMTASDMSKMPRTGIVDDKYDGHYYMPDGSRFYDRKSIMHTEEDVIDDAENILHSKQEARRFRFQEYQKVDAEMKDIFASLIEYLQARNITVDLFLCPLAPALWDGLDHSKNPFFDELDEYMLQTAEKYSLRVTGSFNPHKVGITNADYYDCRHVRRGLISKYFDLSAR